MRTPLRLALLIIDLIAPVTPGWRRATWRSQWRADLVHLAQWLEAHSREGAMRGVPALLARTAGAFRHALSLRIDEWSPGMLTHDLEFAWRTLVRRPAFTLVAVLILALGIGANATIFSWMESVVLQPIPGVDSSAIIALHGTTRPSGR